MFVNLGWIVGINLSLGMWERRLIICNISYNLQCLEEQPMSPHIIGESRVIRKELNSWLDKEEAMWKQRSRNTYLKEGDCNTKFFHSKASSRYCRNTIESLFDEEDVWQEDAKKVEHIVLSYYFDLFTSSNPTDFQELLDAIPPKVLVEMNRKLIREFYAG